MQDMFRDDAFEDDDVVEEEASSAVAVKDFDGLLVAPSDWTVESLYRLIGKQIDLNPAFQRRDVWTDAAQSSLIESFFLNIPIPQIMLAAKPRERSSFIVIDGKQRLLAIKQFIDGKKSDGRPFKLKKMRVLTELEGKTWADIQQDENQKDMFLNSTQRATVLRGWDDEKTLYEIFYRLNNGSVKLSPMELRMSLHPGAFMSFIVKWTDDPRALRRLLRLKNADKRMSDVELAIRFLSFTSDNLYKGDLKVFLDAECVRLNEALKNDPDDVSIVEARLYQMDVAIDAAMTIFGSSVCRKWDKAKQAYESRFNRAIFDIMICSLANEEFRAWALEHMDVVIKSFKDLCENDADFVSSFEASTKNIVQVKKRFSTWYSEIHTISGFELESLNVVDR